MYQIWFSRPPTPQKIRVWISHAGIPVCGSFPRGCVVAYLNSWTRHWISHAGIPVCGSFPRGCVVAYFNVVNPTLNFNKGIPVLTNLAHSCVVRTLLIKETLLSPLNSAHSYEQGVLPFLERVNSAHSCVVATKDTKLSKKLTSIYMACYSWVSYLYIYILII